MLAKYKPSHRKIAMGLLSYMPEEKDVKVLLETIRRYEEDESWRLYLWKQDDDIVAVAGLFFKDEQHAELQHLCVNPSYREEGIGGQLINTLLERLDVKITGTDNTQTFLEQCLSDGTKSADTSSQENEQ
ncbi:GNAT family N-acetyltransferase [Salsuginibacillus kocurii]|uniref:GNAT family N-acetyltransferase n=1 Tax=Salsuginibacillus kocurii TaxID=427078 RepID=UPI000362B5B2|nr:GNAT family N-acetyltransferase [Salsuginibacillus kocurii]